MFLSFSISRVSQDGTRSAPHLFGKSGLLSGSDRRQVPDLSLNPGKVCIDSALLSSGPSVTAGFPEYGARFPFPCGHPQAYPTEWPDSLLFPECSVQLPFFPSAQRNPGLRHPAAKCTSTVSHSSTLSCASFPLKCALIRFFAKSAFALFRTMTLLFSLTFSGSAFHLSGFDALSLRDWIQSSWKPFFSATNAQQHQL